MTLPQAEKMGLTFSPQPQLLLCCPFSPPHSSCRPSTQSSPSVEEASDFTSHPLNTEQSPNLPSVNSHLSLLAPLVPHSPPFQLLLVLNPVHGQVLHQDVNILRASPHAPKTHLRSGGKDTNLVSTDPATPSGTPPNSIGGWVGVGAVQRTFRGGGWWFS